MRSRLLPAVIVLLVVAGCASSSPPSSPRASRPPQVRCLNERAPGSPGDATTTPLVYLFCVQSP
jgi:hypothetical protein